MTRLNIGGPARQEVLLSGLLPDLGWDDTLVYGSVDPGEGEIVPPGDSHTRVAPLRRSIRPMRDLDAFGKVRRIIRLVDPHVVHTHMAKAGALGRIAARRERVPVIVHSFDGHVLQGYFSRSATRAFVQIERSLARHSDALIAVSANVRDELIALGIGQPEQWRVIPHGLDLDGLLSSGIERPAARRTLGLPVEGPIVGIVGRLVPIKDHATFIEAAKRIASQRSDVTFLVAGDGELRGALETASHGLPGMRFVGWVHDLPLLYAAIDVIVLTSRNEGTPFSLIEAAAAGLPAVATDVGGVADVVRDGDTGSLVPAGDAAGVAARTIQLLTDEGLRKRMGGQAREWVRGRFSIARLAGDLDELYRELLDRKTVGNRRP